MSGPTKTQRQHLLARLLEAHAVTSQTQLVDLLATEGVVATQATVSRDLDELGAVKVRTGGGESVYAVPEYEHRVEPEDHLRRVFGDWVVEVSHSGNLVVVRMGVTQDFSNADYGVARLVSDIIAAVGNGS